MTATAGPPAAPARRLDGKPGTPAGRSSSNLRESGCTGPAGRDGNPAATGRAAGARRQPGQVPGVTAGHVPGDGQREVLGQALADAITYRDPAGICHECDTRPEGLCDDHAADLDLADAYLALGRELGIEVQR